MPSKEEEKCLLSIDWDKLWPEVTIIREYAYSRTMQKCKDLEHVISKHINISITNLVGTYSISNNTKLEVIKEIFYKEKEYNSNAFITAIKNIRLLTSCSLKEAKDILDVWKEEFTATKEV
jgi:ribosomal protein L7/L12